MWNCELGLDLSKTPMTGFCLLVLNLLFCLMIPIILKNSFVIVFPFRSQKGSKVYEVNLEQFASMCVDLHNWAKFPFETKHGSRR